MSEREIDNGSYAYMRKVREEHLTELERAKEFDRGYRAGQRSMDAERQTVALKLRGLSFDGGSHENLGKIAYAIYPCATGWTADSCKGLRDKLFRLLGGVNERETTLTTCDALDNERQKAICELRKITIDSHYYGNYQQIALAIGATYDGKRFASECVRDRLIHLLGGDVCEGGNDGDGHQCCGSCAAGGDTNVDKHAEIRAVSNGIAHELREFKGHINAGLAPEMVLALRAEVNGIADRIEEQFARICQQQEAVLQETIEQPRRQMDQQRAMLTQQRDEARAKVIALCNECDKLKRAAGRDADHIESLSGAYNDMERDAEIAAAERDTLQKRLDDMREQREHWADEATKMYRLFFSHDEYCVPDHPSEMVAVAVRTLQDKLDKANGENKGLRLSIDEQKESIAQRKKTIKKLTRDNEKAWKNVHELQNERDYLTAALDDMQADPANDRICKLERERDELQAKLDEIAGVLDG